MVTAIARKNKDVAGTKPAETPAAEAATASQNAKPKPTQTFRVEDVSCSIWAREYTVQGKLRTFYSCTFERSYKARDGGYRYTKSFDLDSLGKLVAVAQKAAEYLHGLIGAQDAPAGE